MPRWSKSLGNSVNFAVEKTPEKNFLENFFKNRAFIPSNEQEQKEYDDFCFVSSAMSLGVYVSMIDGVITEEEKERIAEEMEFQLQQHSNEYSDLSTEFGNSDMEIIKSLFKKFRDEIEKGYYNLDENIRVINMIYGNNPHKRMYLLRFCFIVSFADTLDRTRELTAVEELADKLQIDRADFERIKKEVMIDYKIKE